MLFLPQMAAFVKEAGKKRKKFLSKTQAQEKWAGKVREIFLSIIVVLGKEAGKVREIFLSIIIVLGKEAGKIVQISLFKITFSNKRQGILHINSQVLPLAQDSCIFSALALDEGLNSESECHRGHERESVCGADDRA